MYECLDSEKMALVFELMDSNLYEYYKNKKGNGGLSIDRIRTIVHDILTAVSFLHKKGIFHRDIKPENVLVKGEKVIKLADLGSCKSKNFITQVSCLSALIQNISPPVGTGLPNVS